MTCYHPIKAFIVGENPENGKKVLKFAKNKEQEFYTYCGKDYFDYYLLDCGSCIGCTIKRSRDWATRCMLELRYHERACFITLTYDDEHVHCRPYVDRNGEEQISLTLWKKDFQDFMKRLRWQFPCDKIRYFGCGEYGDTTHRPHYHAIVYGIDFHEDRYPFKTDDDGHVMWRSPTLEKVWTFGHSLIAEVNWNTCAYVARYCTKKKYGRQNIYYQTFNIEPEFTLMSRRPGIAAKYFAEHGDEVYINQEIFLSNNKGGLKVRPPKYFDRLYDIEHHEEMEVIKNARKEMAINAQELKLRNTDLNLFELLEVEERYLKDRLKSLRRDKL